MEQLSEVLAASMETLIALRSSPTSTITNVPERERDVIMGSIIYIYIYL